MSTIALEIHDTGILAVDERDVTTVRNQSSPGYALLDGPSLLTGEEAARSARLKPRWVQHRFWRDLDTAQLAHPFPQDLSNADLAHAHLSGVWQSVKSGTQRVILVVPGGNSDAQLGLILGIARACEMPVSGMVDAAVAGATGDCPASQLLHVDMQLHRTVVTELAHGAEVVRRRVDTDEHTGLVALHDAWVKRIAAVFVRNTRFDPLHSAVTEQTLHDELPDWLERLHDEEATLLTVRAGDKEHSVTMAREELVATAEAHYERIAQLVSLLKRGGEQSSLLLTHRCAALPGLAERMGKIARTEVQTLPQTAALAGALAARESICTGGDELSFVVRLPVAAAGGPEPRPAPTARPATAARDRAAPPTHLLHEGVAWPVSGEPLLLGVAIPDGARGINLAGRTAGISRSHCSIYSRDRRVFVEDHSTHGSFVNDERVDGKTVLGIGDRLRLGSPGIELQLIRVREGDETAQD